jgi:hypothetical protein
VGSKRGEVRMKVIITETYAYEIDIDAAKKKDAIAKANEIYETVPDGYTFTADANSYLKTTFKAVVEEGE